MAMKTFKRYELKYFVRPTEYQFLYEKLQEYMVPDEFCQENSSYMIYNLYFDTMDDSIIRQSISKPYYKEKLRLRSYQLLSGESQQVFLELKKKIGGVVAKRRAVVQYQEALRLISDKILPSTDNYEDHQVLEEIVDFLERYSVTPKVYISYERSAFLGKEDKEFRLSFDKGILTRREDVNLTTGDYGRELLPEGEYLMEVKCSKAMPLWLCSLLSSLEIYERSFSKYGTEYKNRVS